MYNFYLGQSVYIEVLNRIGVVTGIFNSWSIDRSTFEINYDVTYMADYWDDQHAQNRAYLGKRPTRLKINMNGLSHITEIDFDRITLKEVLKQEEKLKPIADGYNGLTVDSIWPKCECGAVKASSGLHAEWCKANV